ncbi:MAG: hypothetical protein RSB25_08195 [Acinetobacter sp.]
MSDSLPLTLEQRIKQLLDTQRKAEFFEAVIDVLKRDYGVSLVKKPPARRSAARRKK